MKIAYFDCPTGLSGNMILAALLDGGLSLSYLQKELKKLGLKGYKLKLSKANKKGFAAKHLHVQIVGKEPVKHTYEILNIIKRSRLSRNIKEKSIHIFENLISAESNAHGKNMSHLHETGATDAIIDIVGTVIALDKLGISEVYCSPLPFGHGKIKSDHGLLPNPAPATLELLKNVPVYKKNINAELVTPTGAAIITSIVKSFTDMPKLELKSTGLGAGTFELKEPNILRIFIGEALASYNEDLIVAIETNIDNMNPEIYGHVIERLMKTGALDAYITPVQMKKGRPGITLTALAEIKDKEKMIDLIFSETTTLGMRTYLVKREKLVRVTKTVRTKYGKVRVKMGTFGRAIKNIAPEYEDCLRLAKKTGIPLKAIYDEVKRTSSLLNL